jgi:RNA polymerase sigma-70 factor (ECF subfamily)
MTTQHPIDDTALVARIAQQEQTALAKLYDRYARILYAVAFKILESVEEAEKVVLDVFCQVWQTAGNYEASRGKVDAWLFLLTRTQALARLRTVAHRSPSATVLGNPAPFQLRSLMANPPEEAPIQERRDRALEALRQLPEEQRQALELAYYQGLTYVEIAAKMGESVDTIKTGIRLGLLELHKTLGSLL